MNYERIAEELVKVAKELIIAGEVPEAFKEQWKKNKKDKSAGEVPEAFREQWKKNKKDDDDKKAFVASSLVKLAKGLLADESPYKTKIDLDTARRDMEHRSIRALNAVLNLGAKSKLVEESLLTYSEGTSHKFHFFALYNDNGTWKAGNAYGRIGGEPKAIMIESSSEGSARAAYNNKLRAKKAKGYEEA
jgi:predicted DNA-binding WGR domain protein